ncbi:NFACT RNA binding domain-containing protein [Algoriphagus sanaruensis]|uniref:RNA-binding protein n=1 Tax=Algoriphagus sanaruensis TaxID=1727163 RepID=A0A142EQI6_9BACT|nr:NFACT RNA binding domain-containing protein [Algoriphagus sanaruensis]AMQ57391.1 RNA-binding protein [Algoriphagus sanaruensis]
MHLNYHFLRYLIPELNEQLAGNQISACFSQSKDELIIETDGPNSHRVIRAHLLPPQVYLAFPEVFHRAKRNTIDLFEPIIGDIIESFSTISFERAFWMNLKSGKRVLFKLHGNRSNLILFEANQDFPSLLFRNEISEDKTLNPDSLEKHQDLSWDQFQSVDGNASIFLPTLGKVPRQWLKEKGYPEADLHRKWMLMQELLDMLDTPLFSLAKAEDELFLSLLPEQNTLKTFANPVEACNELFYLQLVKGSFEKEKQGILKGLLDQFKKTESYLAKAKGKLHELQESAPPSQLADVIMANLHQFTGGLKQVELVNFYTNETIQIELKKGQKPQDLAESLYRKSKNRQLEFDQIKKTIEAKEVFLALTKDKINQLEEVQDFKQLKRYLQQHQEDKKTNQETSSLPFKVFEYEGFTIWVGKSAKDNDEMLRGFAHKDDLWLHARQAAGSHVIIRKKGMPVVPKAVLERAAGLAAFYSKLKNESLAPVIYTEAKYVRKVKGSAPGSVMVDRESVLLIPPQGPDEDTSATKN